jgi:hypothetical protein
MAGTDFPVGPYYGDHIVDGLTISRRGKWWTAILVIEEPSNKKKFINMYRWEQKDGDWKIRKNFKINSKKDADKLVEIINELSQKL